MSQNVYGVQKIDEPEVRTDLQVAGNVAGAAAQGFQTGSKYLGPLGGVGMGIAAGVVSNIHQQRAKRKEEAAQKNAESYNEFVDNLEGRDFRTENMVRAQARYGMKSNNKYENAEIEGDGSGSATNGIGEIHVDKNYNIKNVANGGKRHEDGGFKIDNLEDDDIIFPTQNNKKEYDRVLNLINRYKLRRDPRAKKELDRMRDRLPSDEDYGYDEGNTKQYPEGFYDDGGANPKEQLRIIMENEGTPMTRRQLRRMSDTEAMEKVAKFAENPDVVAKNPTFFPKATESSIVADNTMPDFLQDNFATSVSYQDAADIGKNTAGQTGSAVTGSGSMQQKQNVANDPQPQATPSVAAQAQNKSQANAWDTLFNKSQSWDDKTLQQFAKDNNLKYTDISKEAKARGIDIPAGTLGKGATDSYGNWGNKTAGFFSKAPVTQPVVQSKPGSTVASNNTPPALQKRAMTREEEIDAILNKKGVTNPSGLDIGELEEKEDEEKDIDDEYAAYRRQAWQDINTIEERNNPLKYSSMINKMGQGTKAADKVTRRFYTPEEQEYIDRSAAKRRANVEERNYENLISRGKGLSAGQKQSYAGQIGSRYLAKDEAINETEAQRADAIAKGNVDARNVAKQYNITLANKYDEQDDMNEAVRQKYLDAAYSDMSKFAMLDEQKRYMMDRDRKRNLMNMMTPGLLGTDKFSFDMNDPFKIQYNGQDK